MSTAARAPRSLIRAAIVGGALAAVTLVGLLPVRASASAGLQPLTDGTMALAAPSPSTIKLTTFIDTGLTSPVLITSAHDGTGRLFVVQQNGVIKAFTGGGSPLGTLLDVKSQVSGGSEQGLLGLAFHPDFETNRKFYVNFTNRSGNTVIREYKASASNPNRVAAGSGRTIIQIHQPFSNHNGGDIVFGPGGYLFIGMGDGGDAGDPGNRAQDTASCWARCSGSTSTARRARSTTASPRRTPMWAGPGGTRSGCAASATRGAARSTRRPTACGSATSARAGTRRSIASRWRQKGANLGWRRVEGYACYNPSSHCHKAGTVKPILAYSHAGGRCAVTGGYVYRGSDIPALKGWYVFGDFCSGEIWAVASTAGTHASKVLLPTRATRSARSARTRSASCTSSTWAGRSTGSTQADPDARLDGRA